MNDMVDDIFDELFNEDADEVFEEGFFDFNNPRRRLFREFKRPINRYGNSMYMAYLSMDGAGDTKGSTHMSDGSGDGYIYTKGIENAQRNAKIHLRDARDYLETADTALQNLEPLEADEIPKVVRYIDSAADMSLATIKASGCSYEQLAKYKNVRILAKGVRSYSDAKKIFKIFRSMIDLTYDLLITNYGKNINESADDVFEEGGLSDSMIFQKLNDSSNITNRISEIIKTGVVVEKEYIEEQYAQIAKTHLSPLVDKVLSAYDNGDIVLIYNKKIHLTIALPFTIMKMGGKMKAVIFIADFSGLNKEGTALNIEMKKLYTLMEGGYVALKYTAHPELFTRSSAIAKLTAEIYAEMGLRILNREFALSLEKDSHDMINYGLARFYLQKVFGMTSPEVIHSYAVGVCKSPDNTAMNYVQGLYDTHTINTVEELIAFFVELYPKMEKLTFRYYFERWVSSYAIGATLSIDNFTYLYYVIISVLLGSFMVNNTALNDLVKNVKGMKNFYGEISRITGGN